MFFIKALTYFTILVTNFTGNNEYMNFLNTYNKSYSPQKYELYVNNSKYIDILNSQNLSYEVSINHFADEEFYSMNHFIKSNQCYNCVDPMLYENIDIPESVDWRKQNAVTHVKNQKECGGCWAFSTTGAVEGVSAIMNNRLVNISEQELIDCSKENHGCEGGIMDKAFQFVINNGLCSEDSYSFTARDGLCHKWMCDSVVSISDYRDVEPNNEKALQYAVSKQPVSVAIQANLTSFRFYKRGVYQDSNCGTQLDHGVLIVGYGEENGNPYWIVKNSWSTEWGEDGYIKILRNYNQPTGMCGIAMQPSFPVV